MEIGEEGTEEPEIDLADARVVPEQRARKGLELAQVLGVRPQCVRRRVALVCEEGGEAVNLLAHDSCRDGMADVRPFETPGHEIGQG